MTVKVPNSVDEINAVCCAPWALSAAISVDVGNKVLSKLVLIDILISPMETAVFCRSIFVVAGLMTVDEISAVFSWSIEVSPPNTIGLEEELPSKLSLVLVLLSITEDNIVNSLLNPLDDTDTVCWLLPDV